MSVELLPCPFCGMDEAEITDTMPAGAYWCQCAHCGAETGSSPRQSEAIAAWNSRPIPALEAMGEVDAVIANLRSDAAQLLRMSEAAKFGEEISVRVKSPDLLVSNMIRAEAHIANLITRLQAAEAKNQAYAEAAKSAVEQYLAAMREAHATGDDGSGYASAGSYFSTVANLPEFVFATLQQGAKP